MPDTLPVTFPVRFPVKFVEDTDVNPVKIVLAPPKEIGVVPIVIKLFASLPLVMPPNNIASVTFKAPIVVTPALLIVISPVTGTASAKFEEFPT